MTASRKQAKTKQRLETMDKQAYFEQFRENLYQENLRGAWEFESMRYGIMARLGLDEPDALELAVKIVAGPQYFRSTPQPAGNYPRRGHVIEPVPKVSK